MTTLSLPAFAHLLGVSDRHLRTLVQRGMPATKVKGRWRVDPEAARYWIDAHAPRLSVWLAPDAVARAAATPATTSNGHPPEIRSAAKITTAIGEVVGALLDATAASGAEPHAIAAIKGLAGEARRREKHAAEVRRLEAGLIDRDEHERIVRRLTTIACEQTTAAASNLVPPVMAALDVAGIGVHGAARRRVRTAVWRVAQQHAEALAERLLELSRAGDTCSRDRTAAGSAAGRNGDLAGVEAHAGRLSRVLGAFVDSLHAGQYDPRAITGIKAVSAELRMLERHRVEMRQRDDRVVDRGEHERVVEGIARLVADEIQHSAPAAADAVLHAWTTAGIAIPDSRRSLNLLQAAAEQHARAVRERIADAIESADL